MYFIDSILGKLGNHEWADHREQFSSVGRNLKKLPESCREKAWRILFTYVEHRIPSYDVETFQKNQKLLDFINHFLFFQILVDMKYLKVVR